MLSKVSKRMRLYSVCCIMVILFSAMPDKTVYAANMKISSYEVKYLLDSSKVLNSSKNLKSTYRDLFNTGSSYSKTSVLYLDTKDRDFNNEGWINRIRVKEDASEFELTFKKRYSVSGTNVNDALSTANSEGFTSSDTNYSAEVDWGYSKMTLSIKCEKTKSNKGYDDLELPSKSDAIKIVKDKMPGKEDDWLYSNWGTDTIDDASKVGPLQYKKYKGTYNGTEVVIEIWPITNQSTGTTNYVTELSFKATSYSTASSLRSDLMNYLDNQGILVHGDSLKTQAIMDAYLG